MNYLIIGYGNSLRSDDGVGFQVAETVASWNLSHVRSLACHQLTPEMAADIAQADVVVFVDVMSPEFSSTGVLLQSLAPDLTAEVQGHCSNPQMLLALTQLLYHKMPIAYHLLIPGSDFSFGETLSPNTQLGLTIALTKIKKLVCLPELIR